MWSFFSRDPTKDLGFEIGEWVPGLEDKSIWKLHKGKKKVTGDLVSVFIFEVKPGGENLLNMAKSSVKRLKTMRHPNILMYIDSLETDKAIYLVTEYVEPLEKHLTDSTYTEVQKQLAISWGLHQIARGLGFLITDCNMTHNNICMASVFVDRAGEWHIGGVDYMCPATDSYPIKMLTSLDKYKPPENVDSNHKKGSHKWSRDSWGLGCLIWEAFNGPLPRPASLKTLGKIPQNLAPHYCELVGANPLSRPNPTEFLMKCSSQNGFLKNKFVETLLFLDEIQIKDSNENSRFFNSLTSVIDTFPQDVCKYKILPQLLNAFEFGNAGSAVLTPLFKLGKLLDDAEYQQKIVPCVVKLFSSKDRATRAKLLQQIELFIDHLQPAVVNDQIFPNIVQGFLDTNPVIREHTVRCTLHLAPKLNYHNLNEEILRHFARLQAKDEQGGIRTNTTVCLGKLASYLHPQMRQKVLIPAMTRAMRDPFPPARTAGVLALSATQSYFTLRDCATKVLPALCHLTVDSEKSVRDQAFKAVKGFIGKLEKVSEDPSLAEEMEADVNAASSSSPSTLGNSWAGWAVSSLTAKFYRSSNQKSYPQKIATSTTASSSQSEIGNIAEIEKAVSETHLSREDIYENEDRWNEQDWGSMEDDSTVETSKEHKEFTSVVDGPKDGWEEEDWESYNINTELNTENATNFQSSSPKNDWESEAWESFTEVNQGLTPSSTYNWGSPSSDPFSDIAITKKSPKTGKDMISQMESSKIVDSKSTFLVENTNPELKNEESWNEWDQDFNKNVSNKDELKKKREERRQQRQKSMQRRQGGKSGPMKLGAQKIS